MAFRFELAGDIGSVAGLLADEDFLLERSESLGDLACEASCSGDDEAYTVKTVRTLKQDLPSVLAKVFDSTQTMTLTENWRWNGEGYDGDYAVVIKGQPVTLSATFSLTPDGEGCVYEISHKVKAKIPLIGGKVEKFILGQLEKGITDEIEFLKTRL